MTLGIRLLVLCSIFASSFGASLRTAKGEEAEITEVTNIREGDRPALHPSVISRSSTTLHPHLHPALLTLPPPVGKEDQRKEGNEQHQTEGEAKSGWQRLKDLAFREMIMVSGRARNVSILKMMRDDLDRAGDTFFPGRRPALLGRKFEMMVIALAIAWFFLYRRYLYQDDRRADFSHWSADEVDVHEEADNTLRPDIVLVFSHPNLKKDEKDENVTDDTSREDQSGQRDSVRRNAEHPDHDKMISAHKISKVLSDKVLHGKTTLPRMSKLAAKGEGTPLLDVRKSLLRDMVEILPGHGIQVGIFSSIDGDELFVTLVLSDEKWVRHYVKRDGVKLQLTSEVIKELGVHEPAPEHLVSLTSPPFFRYDHRLAGDIYGTHGKEAGDDSKIYKTYGASKSVLLGIGRIRVVTRLLMDYVDLDKAVQKNILVKWYPCHGEIKLKKLRKYWGNWRLITDLSCVQPLPLICEYFSSRVAFVFAWNGLYSKFLLALVPIAMLFSCANKIADLLDHEGGVWTQGTVLGFSLIVAYWGKFVANQWRREEAYLRVLWDLEGIGQDAAVRPDFHGDEVPSPIDSSVIIQEYPAWKFRLRKIASWSVTLTFCACVVTFVLAWMDQFSGKVSMMGSVVLALMIQIFTFAFNNLVEVLTIHENHKFQRTFYESYLMKTFVFEFINQYTAFFYIALKQQYTVGGCPSNDEGEKDCLLALKKQLPSTLCVLMLIEIVQVILANVRVNALLQWEYFTNERKRTHSYLQALRSIRSMISGHDDNEGAAQVTHNFVEVQGKFGPYRTREQIETMARLCLNLGFALIFGGVVPIIVPMVLLAFLVQLRAKATLLTTATDRPVPRRITGLGPWLDIVELLMAIAVVFTAYVLAHYGPLFQGQPIISKLSGFIIYLFIVQAMWRFHDIVSPAESNLGDLLRQRRELIISKLLGKESEKRRENLKDMEEDETGRCFTNFVEEALSGDWHKIPAINRMAPEVGHRMGLM